MPHLQKFATLADAIALAEFAHRNQKDQSGADYIDHPRRVLQGVQAQGGPPYAQIAAILHDVTEDTAFTPEMILDLGFPDAAVNVIKLLDRDYSRNLYDWYNKFNLGFTDNELNEIGRYARHHTADEFYYWEIRNNSAALQCKLADIGDNTLPWRLSYLSSARQDKLRTKYTNAIRLLTGTDSHDER